jgi:hypothetical protein
MSKIRYYRPTIWSHVPFVKCSITARALLLGIWNISDDNGIHPFISLAIKMQVFPADNISEAVVTKLIDELISNGCLSKYIIENKQYLQTIGWHDVTHPFFQKINKDKATYIYPLPLNSTTGELPVVPQGTTGSLLETPEENRGEEIYIEDITTVVEEDTFLQVPLKDGTLFNITNAKVEEWKSTYTNINVIEELMKLRDWNISNAQKRKTRKGFLTHASKWLSGAQTVPYWKGKAYAANRPVVTKSLLEKTREEQLARRAEDRPKLAIVG